MECMRSEVMKDWSGISINNWIHEQVELGGVLPHSAPTSTAIFSSSCRRASSFPLAHATALPSALKVRSQSESAALNRISTMKAYSLLDCVRNGRQGSPIRFVKVRTPFPQIPERIPSDSEGEDSVVSSDGANSSSDEQDDLAHEFDNFENEIDSQYGDASFNSLCQYDIILPRKKSVRFADDCGGCLEVVRVMTEPSDYPPRISPSIIRRYRQAAKSGKNYIASTSGTDEESDSENEEEKPKASWKIDFTQPASEYVKFRETLESGKVALENVMLKNELCKMLGTIKVANVSFEKRVFVRFTSDGWKSYLDRNAIYQSSPSKTYDTFRFEIEVPMNSMEVHKIEFCICYEAGGIEYWDSNDGQNYALVSPVSPLPPAGPIKSNLTRRNSANNDDAYHLEQVDWARFASWKNLSTDGPYW